MRPVGFPFSDLIDQNFHFLSGNGVFYTNFLLSILHAYDSFIGEFHAADNTLIDRSFFHTFFLLSILKKIRQEAAFLPYLLFLFLSLFYFIFIIEEVVIKVIVKIFFKVFQIIRCKE